MLVRELIEQLSKLPPDATVRFEAECFLNDMEDRLIGSVESVHPGWGQQRRNPSLRRHQRRRSRVDE